MIMESRRRYLDKKIEEQAQLVPEAS